MTLCARCHRPLTRPPIIVANMTMGPTCARLVAGHKPQRARVFNTAAARADSRQKDLFAEAQP